MADLRESGGGGGEGGGGRARQKNRGRVPSELETIPVSR